MGYLDFSQPISVNTPKDWGHVATSLLRHAGTIRIWCLQGDLGAGKTTLVKALCAALGVEDVVNSPTFGLVHTYKTRKGSLIYHFDGYRLNTPEEADNLGFSAYFDSRAYCFIEWPEVFMPLLPCPKLQLHLAHASRGRVLHVQHTDTSP